MNDAIAAVLERLDRLEAKLDSLLNPASAVKLSHDDRDLLGRLLPAIGGKFGSQGVPTREILADATIRRICAPKGAQEIGNILGKAASAHAVIDGYEVSRVSTEGNAALWSVTTRLPEPVDRPPRVVSNGARRVS